MSTFDCPVVRITGVDPIPGVDRIELCSTLGYQVITPKGRFKKGNLAVFVGEGAVLPEALVKAVKGTTKLFGERKNRVRPFLIRKILSDGLLIGPLHGGREGDDASGMLGITKWEPILPHSMRGACSQAGQLIMPYDIENFRRWPSRILRGEEVEITEKIHGTFCGISYIAGLNNSAFHFGDTLIFSKGLARKGLVFRADVKNIYTNTMLWLGARERIRKVFGVVCQATIYGEIFGAGIQDLDYGVGRRFLLFDVYLGAPHRGRFLNRDELDLLKDDLCQRVPVLYRGPFEKDKMVELASGATVSGDTNHMREGVIVTPITERRRPNLGRVILKYVSPEFLSRRDGTEFQ